MGGTCGAGTYLVSDLGGCCGLVNGECVGTWRAERNFRCTTLYHSPPVLPDAAAPTVRAVRWCMWSRLELGDAACPVSGTSFHATLRSFPIGFLDNHLDNSARLNQISANQISANEQKRVKPGIGVTHRPRVVDRNDAQLEALGISQLTEPAETSEPLPHRRQTRART